VATNFTQSVNTSRGSAIITAAGSGCTLKIYTGSAPTNADTTASGTLLATLTISGALGTEASGVLTFGTVTAATAVATGTAGYARLATSGGTTICDFTTIATSGADINLNSVSISSGGQVSITSGTITEAYP
jgi:hypothetical protein